MDRPALILDLDGTLWDSRPWYAEVLARLSGGSVTQIQVGLASGIGVVRLARECGVTRARFAAEARCTATPPRLYEGVLQTLETLRECGASMGAVTNLPAWLVKPMVGATGVDVYIDVTETPVRGRVQAKPRPDGILRALGKLGKEPCRDVWYVGDGLVDAQAAQAAGVSFAWASYGYDSAPPPGTETVLGGFQDVLGL